MRIIEETKEKIKPSKQWLIAHEKELFIALLVILTSSFSYGLGRLSKIEDNRLPVTITAPTSSPIKLVTAASANTADNRLVASKKGTKYYFPWCGGGKTIKAENRIYFVSAITAETAGYTRAGNCSDKP
ncbi:MAG: hypothetical protein NTY66_01930 [Candidatus Vogelbacteria bacterium]|nr:hypothetical protein [Candidatus Vogelbacteria bacterium]